MLVKNLDLKWPSQIKEALDSITFLSAVTGDVFQVDCFFKNINHEVLVVSLFSISIIMMAFMPFLLALVSLLFWKLISIFKPRF